MEQSTKTLFSEKSEAYSKYRPGYPGEAIETILESFDDINRITAVDIGAGTGIASRLIAGQGATVIALEPNEEMIHAAAPHPNITYLQSSAELTPMEESTVDLVTSFQAFHWFNFKKSLKEFNRILKPSGRLSLIWSYWDVQDPFTASYSNFIEEATEQNLNLVTPYDGPAGKIKKMRIRILWKLKHLPYFKNVQRHHFKHVQDTDLEALIGCAKSQSYIEHTGPVWDQLVQQIETLYTAYEKPELKYNINVFTAVPQK